MGWILLLLYEASTFAVVVDSPNDCMALVELNRPHWIATGQNVQAMCVKTFEI